MLLFGLSKMFDSANLDHSVDKSTYKKEKSALRAALLDAQFNLSQAKRSPVLVLIDGVEGAGKSETVNLLHQWMDPRHIQTTAFGEPNEEERARPRMWRYWRALPPKGSIGVFFGAWHTQPIVDRAFHVIGSAQLEQHVAEAQRFEQMLADEGVALVKLWFHLTKEQQRKRLHSLEKDARTRWRVTKTDWAHYEKHDRLEDVAERYLRATSTGACPWIVIAGNDSRYRNLSVGKALVAAMRDRLEQKEEKKVDKKPKKSADRSPPLLASVDRQNVIRALDLKQKIEADKYERELETWQGRLALLSRDKRLKERSVVCVFEGNDAAGKGGAIRRVIQALDARFYRGVSIAAPTDDERAQPYLWRFWRHVPPNGRFAIFDRSWYGRVLVERVEGLCTDADWMRGYAEINDFEEQLARHGAVVCKFWLAITKEEQLKRFKARESVEFKQFKITGEDWRNREKWDAYEQAVCDMVDRTSTQPAPWTLIEANDKHFARIKVLKTLVKRLDAALSR